MFLIFKVAQIIRGLAELFLRAFSARFCHPGRRLLSDPGLGCPVRRGGAGETYGGVQMTSASAPADPARRPRARRAPALPSLLRERARRASPQRLRPRKPPRRPPRRV